MADDDRPADRRTLRASGPPEGVGADALAALAELSQKFDSVTGGLAAIAASHTELLAQVTISLGVLAQVAESVERLDSRTEDRLAAVRDAALAPVADLQALLSARNESRDTQLAQLSSAVETLAAEGPEPVRERLAELAAELAAVRDQIDQIDRIDVAGPLAEATEELGDRLTIHTDTALAGVLRMIDDRLAGLLSVDADAGATPQDALGGYEAAWTRLEQRLDSEFDDLGRQLQSMASLIEQAAASREATANRPVVTADQLRKAASAVKDTVAGASRSRRDRRGGPRGLGSG